MPPTLRSLLYQHRRNRRRQIVGIGLALALVLMYPAVTLKFAATPRENMKATASVIRPQSPSAPFQNAIRDAVAVHGPLKVSANRRYLVDRNNRPFLIVGDAPQALIVNLSVADADRYLADRHAAGFNAVWVNLLCDNYTGGRSDGSTYDGILPFTTTSDLATPNPSYFSRVDTMIHLAAKYNITVFLDPIETGGWLNVLRGNGAAKDYRYGVYLGRRYKSFPNIVWMSGNDFQSWQNRSDDAVVRAVAQGIKVADPNHIHTIELNYFVSASLDDASWAPIIRLDAAYTYSPTYAEVLREYNRSHFLPTFLMEANYEYENNTGHNYGSPQTLRRQEYWTMLSGAAGQFYGNGYTWPFKAGWQSHLDTPGSAQVGYLADLFGPRQWYALVPDESHSVVVSGYGTFSSGGSVNESDYVTAVRTPDGSLVMAYLPTRRTVTVDMTRLSGPALARWYDPTSGTYTAITRAPLANTGTRRFTPPGNNKVGDGDWVLVLERQPGRDHKPATDTSEPGS